MTREVDALPEAPTDHSDNLTRAQCDAWLPLVGEMVRWQDGAWFVNALVVYDSGRLAGRGSVVLSPG